MENHSWNCVAPDAASVIELRPTSLPVRSYWGVATMKENGTKFLSCVSRTTEGVCEQRRTPQSIGAHSTTNPLWHVLYKGYTRFQTKYLLGPGARFGFLGVLRFIHACGQPRLTAQMRAAHHSQQQRAYRKPVHGVWCDANPAFLPACEDASRQLRVNASSEFGCPCRLARI